MDLSFLKENSRAQSGHRIKTESSAPPLQGGGRCSGVKLLGGGGGGAREGRGEGTAGGKDSRTEGRGRKDGRTSFHLISPTAWGKATFTSDT